MFKVLHKTKKMAIAYTKGKDTAPGGFTQIENYFLQWVRKYMSLHLSNLLYDKKWVKK